MNFSIRSTDLRKLNARLLRLGLGYREIDGVNARIVLTPDNTYLIGSREEFLYARGDCGNVPRSGVGTHATDWRSRSKRIAE